MQFELFERTMPLVHRFTISRWSKDASTSIFVRLRCDGLEGWGEASPNKRYDETPASCKAALTTMTRDLPGHPGAYVPLLRDAHARVTSEYAAKAALDMAVLDWVGKSLQAPLYRLWGLDGNCAAVTSMTIGMDQPQAMAERVGEAAGFSVLKIKLGGSDDRAMIEAIRAAGATCLRVDANEGWRDRETALRDIEWLASRGVVLVEQPMPATQMADMAWLKARSPLPLYADEAFGVPADVLDLKEGYHGINIKLMKCGGLLAAREAISLARAVGMDVMLGCMVESSLGIAAAAQLSPLADCLDLDGNLLLAEDPFEGHAVVDGQIQLNQRPGCGAVPKALLPKS